MGTDTIQSLQKRLQQCTEENDRLRYAVKESDRAADEAIIRKRETEDHEEKRRRAIGEYWLEAQQKSESLRERLDFVERELEQAQSELREKYSDTVPREWYEKQKSSFGELVARYYQVCQVWASMYVIVENEGSISLDEIDNLASQYQFDPGQFELNLSEDEDAAQ